MPAASDAVWLSVLPDMKGFGPALAKGSAGPSAAAGATSGKAFGTALLAGMAVVAGGAALAAAALYNVGKTFDDVSDTIRVGTGATGAALTALETSAKNVGQNVPASFEDVGTAIADINTRLGLTGKPLEDVSAQFLELSRITGTDVSANIENVSRVFGDWGVAAEDQAGSLDYLFKVSQSTGIGLDELSTKVVQYGAPMRQFGFSFEESAALMGKWAKEGVNTETIMGGLRAGLGKLAKAGKDPAAAFQEVTAKIKNAGSEGEATAIAIETFGQRAGPDLAAAVREGRFELDDLMGTFDASGETIMQAGADTMDFSEQWLMFKNKVMVGLEPIAKRVFSAIGAGMETLTQGATAFGAAWRYNDDEVTSSGIPGFMERLGYAARQTTDFLRANATAIGIVTAAAAALVLGIVIYNTTVKTVTAVTKAWATAQLFLNGTLVLNPIGLVVVALVALVAAIIIAYKNSETFRNVVQAAWVGIQTAVSYAWENVIQPVLAALHDFITKTLGPAAMWLWNNVIEPAFKGIGTAVASAWNNVIKPLLTAWWAYITNVLIPVVTWLWRNVVEPAFSGIGAAISVAWNVIKLAFDLWKFYMETTLAPVVTWLWQTIIRPAFEGIGSAIKSTWENVISPVLTALGNFIEDTVAPAFSRGVDAIGSAWNRIAEIARQPVNFVIDSVYNNGIRDTFNKIAEAVGSDARLPFAALVGAATGGGKSQFVQARARGGWTPPGMTLVGEEGPELVDFISPGRVYTASQSRSLLGGPVLGGDMPREGILGKLAGARDFVMGGLQAAAERAMSSLVDQIPAAGVLGSILRGVASKAIDLVRGFGRKQDESGALTGGGFGKSGAWPAAVRGRVSPNTAAAAAFIRSTFGISNIGTLGNRANKSDHPMGKALDAMIANWSSAAGIAKGNQIASHFVKNPGQFGTKYVIWRGQINSGSGWRGYRHPSGQSNPTLDHFDHPHVSLYDRGGYLPPGVSTVRNATGKPEAILNPQQWTALSTAAARGAAPYSFPDRVTLEVEGEKFTAYVRRESAAGARHDQRMYQGA